MGELGLVSSTASVAVGVQSPLVEVHTTALPLSTESATGPLAPSVTFDVTIDEGIPATFVFQVARGSGAVDGVEPAWFERAGSASLPSALCPQLASTATALSSPRNGM